MLRNLFAPRENRAPERSADPQPGAYGVNSWAEWLTAVAGGETGGVARALRNAASFACIDVLADSIARTPFDAIRHVGPARQPIDPAPSILANPSGIVLPDVWRTQFILSLVTDGNAFGQIVSTDADGRPTQAETIDPAVVGMRQVDNGVPKVSVSGKKLEALWPFGDIWHIPGRMVLPGSPFGVSPVTQARKTIGTSLSVEDFSARFFDDGAHPTAIVYSDTTLDDEAAKGIKAALLRATRGNREPAVMGSGLKVEPYQIAPGETQFLELLRFCVEQTCRFWRVPPSMVYAAMSGQNVTYANVTQADLHYLKHSLEGYYVRLEHAFGAVLPRGVSASANRNAVLRSDVTARYEAYAIAVRGGWRSVNEVRALEDEPPIEGGDVYLWPPGSTGTATPAA